MAIIDVTSPQFGAKGDVKTAEGTIISPLNVLTITSLPAPTLSDVGKPVLVAGAGSQVLGGERGPLYTTIQNVNGTTVVLADSATMAVTTPTEVQWGTDDTDAFTAAAGDVEDGDELHIPAGTYWIYPDSHEPLEPGAGVADFSGRIGVRVVGNGAILLTARTMRRSGLLPGQDSAVLQRFNLFSFEDCSDVEVTGLKVRGHRFGAIGQEVVQNAVFVRLYGGCRNVRVAATCTGIISPLLVTAGPRLTAETEDFEGPHGFQNDLGFDASNASSYAGLEAQRSHGIRIDAKATNCGYGAGFQFSGDDVKGTLITDGCYRSYIAYGVSNHWMNIDSRNYQGADVLLQCFGGRSGPGMPPSGYGVQHITIDYTNRETTSVADSAAVELEFAANVEGVHHNIHVHYDVRYNPSAVFGPVLRVNNSSPAADDPSVPFSGVHKVERLRLEGRVEGPGAPYDFNFSAHNAGGKVELHDLVLENLTLLGTQPPDLNLTRLVDRVECRNLVCDTSVSVQTAGSARVWWVRCRAPAASSIGSSVPADYVDCFIGAYHHAAKYREGGLNAWFDAFRVRHLGTAAAYCLHYYVVQPASFSKPRKEIVGIATWSAVMDSTGSLRLELPVQHVRRTLIKWPNFFSDILGLSPPPALPVPFLPALPGERLVEVTLKGGPGHGIVQLQVPNWSGANARAAFHLEVMGLPVQDVAAIADM